ncbi:MAG: YggS family pyridoxal phosphate-dependent enzyme [Oscillospiraceae bacterium]|nr:YggS family pyridoxal phosphate-dependent enzyme [Oscillospiraceae bacterium]
MSDIQENILEIREKMARAARAAGRDPGEIRLCAASKMNDAARVQEAVQGGVDCCGENRVQELLDKLPKGAYTGRPVHFIGHLQTNKVNRVVGAVDLIQSVDRPDLLAAVEKEAKKKGLVQNILLEVNIGGESSKSGYTPEEAAQTAAKMADFPGVHLCGLMAIPPVSQHPGDNRKYFAQMANLFVDIGRKKYDNVTMVCLSMGMSDDYEDAIAEGSTMIRVGTAIFGARNYNTK